MFLGIDLGTSALKGLLIDDAQNTVGSASAPLKVSRPHEGWSEQDPQSWITACELVLNQLTAEHPAEMASLRGIGLSGQMHGATLIGADDQPLRPCILWNDSRSHIEAMELDAQPQFREISGNIVFPGFTAPKILWVKRHEPAIFAQLKKILLPKDFLRLWLTGEHISDMSDSAGTSWLDVASRDWSDELLAATGLSRSQMPDLVEGSEIGGMLRPEHTSRWGLPRNIPVAGGAGDNAASAIGMGTVRAGQAFISLGTSGVLFAANDAYLPRPESAVHTFCHALPKKWHQMGVILSAADSLNWYGRIVGASSQELTAELGALQQPDAVQFLPYLGGERTPHNDANIRGAFLNLSHIDDRNSLTRAVLHGVGFAFRDNLEALRSAGTKITNLLAVGGGSLSEYWLKAIATILDIPIALPVGGDFGAAFGAARLGMMASGVDEQQVCISPDIARKILPEPILVAAYDDAYHSYKSSYPTLKGT